MKLYARWAVSAGLLLAAFPAQAQMLAPGDAGRSLYRSASDLDEPYEPAPPGPPSYAPYAADPYVPAPYAPYPPNAYVPTPYAYEPAVVAAHEIYAVLRENGFVPLGILHREGFVYSISAVDPDGEDGRVLIDARTGRILRFMPAYSWGGRGDASPLTGRYAAQAAAALPAASTTVRALPRPPAAIPHVAGRSPKPTQAKPADAAPSRAAVQRPAQSAAAQVQSGAPAAPAAAATAGETKPPSPVIRPTEPMPQVQGLE
jgi:hypothetical protein